MFEFHSNGKVTKDEWFRNVTFEAAGFNAQENVNLENIEVLFIVSFDISNRIIPQ